MTFDQWYTSHEWWKDNKDSLEAAWKKLEANGVDPNLIAESFSSVAIAVTAEFGE